MLRECAAGAVPQPGRLPPGLSCSLESPEPLNHAVCPACSCTSSCTTSGLLVRGNGMFCLFILSLYKMWGLEQAEVSLVSRETSWERGEGAAL